MNKNTRNLLLALATAALGVPLAGYALAQTPPNQGGAVQDRSTVDNDVDTRDDPAPAYRSSIQLPAEQPGTEVPDDQEEARLRALARITPTQAGQAAQVTVPGTVGSVTLENEDGHLVYAVVIGRTEVKVDAGDGRVLHQEQGGDREGGEGSETSDGR